MNKRWIGIILALVLCVTPLAGCGVNPQKTLSAYFEKQQQNAENQNFMAEGNIHMEMAMSGETLAMDIDMKSSQIGKDTTVDMKMTAQTGSGETVMDITEYIATDGSKAQVYINQNGQWNKMTQEISDQDISAVMMDMMPESLASMDSIQYVGKEKVRDREAHHIEYRLNAEALSEMVGELIGGMGVSQDTDLDEEAVAQFYDALKMGVWIDTETNDALKATMVSEEGATLDMELLSISALSCDMEYYDYGAAQALPLPEGAESAIDYDEISGTDESGETDGTPTPTPAATDNAGGTDVLDDITGSAVPDAESAASPTPGKASSPSATPEATDGAQSTAEPTPESDDPNAELGEGVDTAE